MGGWQPEWVAGAPPADESQLFWVRALVLNYAGLIFIALPLISFCSLCFFFSLSHLFCLLCFGFLCFIGFPQWGGEWTAWYRSIPTAQNQNHLGKYKQVGVTSTRVCAAVMWSCLVAPTSCCLAFQLMALATLVSTIPYQPTATHSCPPRGQLFQRCTPNEAVSSFSSSSSSSSFSFRRKPAATSYLPPKWRSRLFGMLCQWASRYA